MFMEILYYLVLYFSCQLRWPYMVIHGLQLKGGANVMYLVI